MLTDIRYQLLFNYCVLQIVKSLKTGPTKRVKLKQLLLKPRMSKSEREGTTTK